MTNAKLKSQLQRLVDRYGIDEVSREMQEMAPPERETGSQNRRRPVPSTRVRTKGGPTKPRPTATEYVARMVISSDRRAAALALAGRFEDKSFLPTCADIRNFCRIYGIEEPASKARMGAIPRIFKFVAAMEAADIQRLLDEDTFSGPARLGPLAEAIRRNGRAARQRDADGGYSSETEPGNSVESRN